MTITNGASTTNGPGGSSGAGGLPFAETLGQRLVAGGHRRLKQERRQRAAVRGGIALTATAVVAGGVFGLLPGGNGTLGTVDTAAAATLQRASTVAASGPGLEDVEPGQYWYQRWESYSNIVQTDDGPDGEMRFLSTQSESEDWIGVDGVAGFLRTDFVEGGEDDTFGWLLPAEGTDDMAPGFAEEIPDDEWETVYEVPDGVELTEYVEPEEYLFSTGQNSQGTYDDLAALPTDPAQLRESLIDSLDRGWLDNLPNPLDPGQSTESALIEQVSDMLHQPMPSELRAALFTVLAETEGVTQSEVTDQLGRPALAVGWDYPGGEIREELLFDRESGAFIGRRTILVEPGRDFDGEPGDVLSGGWLVESAIVDQVGERP